MKTLILFGIKAFFKVAPAGAAEFLYTKVLKPRPLRTITNYILTFLIPEKIFLDGATFYLNQKDPVVSGALLLGAFEKYEIILFKQYLKEGTAVLDIGANIGYYTVLAAMAVGTGGRVISFEPEPVNHSYLQKNITANNLVNVTAVETALSNANGMLTLHLNDDNKGRHSLVDYQDTKDVVQVEAMTLDSFLKKENIKKVDVIKMDVEGAEGLVIEGMSETLAVVSPVMFVEFFPAAIHASGRDPLVVLEKLQLAGFSLNEIDEAKERTVIISNLSEFVKKYSKEKPANILCVKK